jgi:Tfp pilus assembly protein PilV
MIGRRLRSFTLLETIAAVVLLGVGIPPLLWAIREAHVQRVNPVMASTARWLVTEKLEDVLADRHSTTRGYDYLVSGNYPAEVSVAGFSGFSRSVTLTETTADLVTPGEGYMTVTVEVSWTDATSTVRTLSVSTVVTEYEP